MGLIFILSLLFWGWAEMSAFIYIGNELGGLITLLGVFFTAIMGIALLKNQGISVLNRISSDMAKGRASMSSVADSISLVIGGILMLIPGYLTDVIGLFLFVPGFRTISGIYFIKLITRSRRFSNFVNRNGSERRSGQGQNAKTNTKEDPTKFSEQNHHHGAYDDIIEGTFEERVSPKPQHHDKIGKP